MAVQDKLSNQLMTKQDVIDLINTIFKTSVAGNNLTVQLCTLDSDGNAYTGTIMLTYVVPTGTVPSYITLFGSGSEKNYIVKINNDNYSG